MSWDKHYRTRCDMCNKYCVPADSYTSYGCKSYEPPEPLDPVDLCAKDALKLLDEWRGRFAAGSRQGDWEKSNAERTAAKEHGLSWVGGSGVGMLGTDDFANAHQYITAEEYERLSKLPYWGYCKVCGAERKGGYCGAEECLESFTSKTAPKEKVTT